MATWAHNDGLIETIIAAFIDEYPQLGGIINNPNTRARIQNILDALDLGLARRQSMVWDKILTAAQMGTYGDLGIETDRTDLGTIVDDFKAAYAPGFLDCFDEDGNYIC